MVSVPVGVGAIVAEGEAVPPVALAVDVKVPLLVAVPPGPMTSFST